MLKRQRILIVDQTFQPSAVMQSAKWLTVTTDANQGVIYKTQPDQIDSISPSDTLFVLRSLSFFKSYQSKLFFSWELFYGVTFDPINSDLNKIGFHHSACFTNILMSFQQPLNLEIAAVNWWVLDI